MKSHKNSKVYLVIHEDFYDATFEIYGVYRTKKLANNAIKDIRKNCSYDDFTFRQSYFIEIYELIEE